MTLEHYHEKKSVLNEYRDDTNLSKRKRIFSLGTPKISIIEEVCKLIDFSKTKDILDIGCGNGDLLVGIRKAGFKGSLTGMDISNGIMKTGIETSKKENLDIKFEEGTAENLRFDDDSFDVIIAKHMLYHVPDMQKAVDESYRCIKKGGYFIVTLNSGQTRPLLNRVLAEASKKTSIDIKHERRLTVEKYPELAKKFSEISLKEFKNHLYLQDPSVYIDYLDACRNLLNRVVTDKEWKMLMKEARVVLDEIVQKEGKIVEHNSFGIFVCKK